ncbi:MAG: hypothetical protein R3C14_35270 [Caldilineaceae bacterium]
MPQPTYQAAIDFGISNTDIVARIGAEWRMWTAPYTGHPDAGQVRTLLAQGNVALEQLAWLGVSGGRHRLLPAQLGNCTVVSIGELEAIGRGGQIIAERAKPEQAHTIREQPILVVSAGSGTAMVAAQGERYSHVTGTAVGGGTLLGLGRLLLNTIDPQEINRLAEAGNANGVDLSLADVITGPIGALPAAATAVNFGRLARENVPSRREDLAAALVTLIGQTIALVAINAAKAQQTDTIVVTGHMTDMATIRHMLAAVGRLYGMSLHMPTDGGYATALGALAIAERQMN